MGLFSFIGKRKRTEEIARGGVDDNRSRHAMLKQRKYGATEIGGMVSSWGQAPQTADQSIYQNLRILRARARDQFEGNDFARRFVGMAKTHVVGADGFTFQAATVGLDGKQDSVANLAIESAWKEWQRAGTCDVAGRLHFTDINRLIMGSIVVDGEVLIQRRMGSKYGKSQYALKLIDPELLDVNYNEDLKNGNKIRFGIELDEDERPVNYFFKKTSDSVYYSSGAAGQYTKVPAAEITHLFITERVGQKRGIPWLATPLLRMQMLDGYSEAALTAARIGATKAVFYTTDPEAELDATVQATMNAQGEMVEDIEPGSANVLPAGVGIESYDPTYPHSDFDSFTKTQLRSIAAGLGVSYHKLANDLEGVNYSSGRLGELEDREIWKQLQSWMIESFLRPLYEDWIELQLMMGTITVPTRMGERPLSGKPEKYKKVSFQGRRWAWTDPLKEAKGNQLNLDYLITSPQRVISDAGYDPEEIIDDWAKWEELLKSKGIRMPSKNEPVTSEEDHEQD